MALLIEEQEICINASRDEDVAIIEMDLDNNYIEETFDHDEGFFKCKAYMYKGDISTDNITNYWTCPAFQTSTNLSD